MEGVIIVSNNKPLLSSHFARPRLADLAVDAFLSQRRAATRSGSVLEPVVWFEAVDLPLAGPSESLTSLSQRAKGKKPGRKAHAYGPATHDDDEDESSVDEAEDESSSSSEDDDDDDDDDDRIAGTSSANAWAQGKEARQTALACCHITHNGLHFLAPIRRETDPAVAFTYLYSLVDLLRIYLNGEVSDASLRDYFDVVLQLLAETFSAPYPISTDASALSELVPSDTFLNKVISAGLAVASTAANSSGVTPPAILAGHAGPAAPFSSPLHWRRAGIRYVQNEIYFDINEDIRAILDKNGNVLSGDVWGQIDCRCRLSGMPDLSLNLSNPNMLEDPSFHPCVRLSKWTTSKQLSFVPPDGQFTLMGYRLGDVPTSIRQQQQQRTAQQLRYRNANSVPLPFRVHASVTTGEIGGSFEISLAPPASFTAGVVNNLEDVRVKFRLGEGVTNVKASITSPHGPSSSSRSSRHNIGMGGNSSSMMKSSSSDKPSAGAWQFESASSTLLWTIPKLGSASPTLRGTWQFDDSLGTGTPSSIRQQQPSPVIEIAFKAALANISGLGIVNLKMDGEKYSMYKAVRSNLTGSVEVRW